MRRAAFVILSSDRYRRASAALYSRTVVALGLVAITSTLAFARPRPAKHYAALFDAKATWTYEVANGAAAATTVTCKVARVAAVGRVLASEVVCEGADDAFPVARVYLATASGLYSSGIGFPETADDLQMFSLNQLLIGAAPKATKSVVKRYAVIDQQPVPVTTTFAVERQLVGQGTAAHRVWCWVRTTEMTGSTSTDAMCFDGAIISGVERDRAFRRR